MLPEGWRDRLVEYRTDRGAVAYCLDLHDVVVAKLVAGRPKDLDYCATVIAHDLVTIETVRERLGTISRDKERIPSIDAWLTEAGRERGVDGI